MPTVTPISTVPNGLAAGGGIETKVTYEIGAAAANDAGVAAAANEASYVTRAVAISDGTLGTIAEGVAGRLFWPIAAVTTAYALYKWYTDKGVLMSPGVNYPQYNCAAGGSFYTANIPSSPEFCSLPGASRGQYQYLVSPAGGYGGASPYLTNYVCDGSPGASVTCYATVGFSDGTMHTHQQVGLISYHASGATGAFDPAYVSDPAPVTTQQVGHAMEQYPDSWQQLLTDPRTNTPLITPEIASDMDALKHQIAPQYGVDPTTLPQTQPDTQYQQGQADHPGQTSLPQYCAWASSACAFYQFVEDNWPNADGKKQFTDGPDCATPPACSGDEIMCGVVLEQFKMRCQFVGDGQPPDSGKHVVSELYTPDVDLGDTSGLDQGGFGLSTACPFTNITADYAGQTTGVNLDFICTWGVPLRVLILLCAAMACAKIMGGVQTNT